MCFFFYFDRLLFYIIFISNKLFYFVRFYIVLANFEIDKCLYLSISKNNINRIHFIKCSF